MRGGADLVPRDAGDLVRNSGSALLLTVAQAGSRFAGALLIAHYLGSYEFGVFAVTWAYLELFRVAADFGLEPVLVRRTALDPSAWPGLVESALVLKLVLASAAALLALGLGGLWGYPGPVRALLPLAVPSLFLTSAANVLTVPYVAALALHRIAWVAIGSGALYLAAVIAAGTAGLGISWFVACLVGHDAATLAGVLLVSGRRRPAAARPRAAVMANLLREARAPALTSFLVTAYVRVGLLLVGAMGDMRAAGNFALATRLAEACKLVGGAVATSAFPLFARQAGAGRHRDMARLFWTVAAILAASMLAFALLVQYRLAALLPIVFPRYEQLDAFLVPLMWAMVFVFVNMHASALLSGLGMFWLTTVSAAVNLAVSVAANAALVPRWGSLGAAWAYLVTEGVNSAVQLPIAGAAVARPPSRRPGGVAGAPG